tara:strand:- start:247 stop:453 length:207 start_codon:yes stop_codon:yes gene_type:complete
MAKKTKSKSFNKMDLINPLRFKSIPFYLGLDSAINSLTPYSGLLPFKKGGRVGCGKAKRGFGKALRKK